jgi:hypothetical protein
MAMVHSFLGLPSRAPADSRRATKAGKVHAIRRWLKMLRLWNRLCNLDRDCILKHTFTLDVDLTTRDNNWCAEIREISSTFRPCNLALI